MSSLPPTLEYKSPTGGTISKVRKNAIRSLRGLGLLCMALAVIILVAALRLNSLGVPVIILAVMGFSAFVLMGLGSVYWICSIKIKHFSPSAALVAIIIASLQLAFALLSLIGSMVQFAQGQTNAIPSIVVLVFIFGLIQLISHLAKVRREVI